MENKLIKFRRLLHKRPELSGNEKSTSNCILQELKKLKPDKLLRNLGGHGVLAVYYPKSSIIKQRILLRAELDAIAVHETTGLNYASEVDGVMHGCGHDGHMAILMGVAECLQKNRPDHTEVILLFQPSEENGEGAEAVLDDVRFKEFEIDHGFAVHNLPGFDFGSLILKDGVFSCASAGLEIKLTGRSSHAAYPEQGINPVNSLTGLLTNINQRFENIHNESTSTKAVVTYIHMGERAFGVSPGVAKAGFTLRSADDAIINREIQWIKDLANDTKERFKGKIDSHVVEPFPAVLNCEPGNHYLKKSAEQCGLEIQYLDKPFPWSEDFGRFRTKFPITLFGLGAGKNHPPLHSEHYDFNDRLIAIGKKLFSTLIKLMDSKT